MTKNVVRIQTEMFKPGELVRGHLIDIYLRPPSNYAWHPRQPKFQLVPNPEGAHTYGHPGEMLRFDEGGLLFRFDALGEQADGFSKGDIDFLLQTIPASKLFAEDIPHFATLAHMSLESFKNRAWWATLALYDVDVDQQKVWFDAKLELSEVPIDETIQQEDDRKRSLTELNP
jgi:hypothetical protein